MLTIPQLNGLVLAGGKSSRMGRSKGMLNWHGKEQQYYMADLLGDLCKSVFISVREEQADSISAPYRVLGDSFPGIGPYGGILSAFKSEPGAAWLTVACDLPLLDKKTLAFLLENRDTEAVATSFISPSDGLPEPMITIWEPASYEVLQNFLAMGYTCPRKVLLRCGKTHLIQAPDADVLMNVNTPEDFDRATVKLRQKQLTENVS